MKNNDLARLEHMLDSTKAVLSFVKGKRRASLTNNRLLQSAVMGELANVGKAANRVSKKTRTQFTHLPWKEMIKAKIQIIHAYFDVDQDVIWKTIRKDLPQLQKQLEEAISSFDSD